MTTSQESFPAASHSTTEGSRSFSELHDLFSLAMQSVLSAAEPPDEDSPLAELNREFFENNWVECRDGLLAKTSRIRVTPGAGRAPCVFRFEIDTPYRRKRSPADPVELVPGPVRGAIFYRADLFEQSGIPSVAVFIDPDLGYFHPNCSRSAPGSSKPGLLCLGKLDLNFHDQWVTGPIPLSSLLEHHLYPILTYQNRTPTSPLDKEAAIYFATNPEALVGLTPVAPLY